MMSNEEMKAMDGTEGSQILNLDPEFNELWTDDQVEQQAEFMGPRQYKKFVKRLVKVREVWTWIYGWSHFNGGEHVLRRTSSKLFYVETGEPL